MAELGRLLKKILGKLLSRVVITMTLLILQAVWLVVMLVYLADYMRGISLAMVAVSVIMCAALIRQDSTVPEFKISWMVLFMVMPVQGGLLYILWGDKRPAIRLRKKLEWAAGQIRPLIRRDPAAQQRLERSAPRAGRTAAYLRDYADYPVYGGTDVRYYSSGEAVYADLIPALESARKFIFVEFFIISKGEMWDSVHAVLRRKAAEGVDVRLIYDDVGCAPGLPAGYWKTLEAEGIRAVPFNPFVPILNLVMNSRDHRKIVVVDGRLAFTGGFNLADEYINRKPRFGHWRDTAIRLDGPGAWGFVTMFLRLWASQRPDDAGLDGVDPRQDFAAPHATVGLVQPYSDNPVDNETVAKNVYLELIDQAQQSLWITTPYLILDNTILSALCLAAKRGVDVRIYTPGIPDKKIIYQLTKSYFAPLIRSGVKIFTYTPGFLHAKTWLVDGRIGAVGAINLDYRSLYLHFECSVLLYGCPALADVAADLLDIERVSHRVALRECRTSAVGNMISAALRLLAPLC
ncbi:MAG: cardiolipin synthase [Gemmiger sp.]|uniref:cardiolipin synthase n=1 Tax=Gemmiger sp. TaxID=2049027 RepID=UPI002E798365|nr:cardiolipin synthase [Gemmiger sp.]MEE0802061.1 cardiolipin synthase [Gemmiger sp.]